jgi:hypothetical protein
VNLRLAALALALTSRSTALAADSAAATELARLLVPRQYWSDGVGQLAQQVQGQMQMHPGQKLQYPPDFPETVRTEIEQAVPYDETVAIHARELQASFAEAELKGLVGFFGSPLGRKFLATSPDLQTKVGMETERRLQQTMPGIMARLAARVKQTAGAAPPGHPATGGTPATPPAAPPSKGVQPARKK